MNSFSALQKMSLDCPRATKILIEDVLMLGTVDEPAINERLCEYYSDTILLRLMQDATEKFKDMTSLEKGFTEGFTVFAGRDTFISHTGSLLANLSTQPVGSGGATACWASVLTSTWAKISALSPVLLRLSAPLDESGPDTSRLFYLLSA